MNDRFKFRMFDKNIRKMWNFDNDCMLETVFECLKQQLAFDSGLEIFKPIAYDHISDGRIFMQCTGLKDNNGTLIYEGDIVRFYSLYGHATFEIKWSEEFATFGYEDNETDFSEFGRLYDGAAFVEVIGNIYENKELLESEG